MAATSVSITTNLFYATEPVDGAQAYVEAEARTNYGRDEKSVVIENVRGEEDSVSLDTTGFQFYKHTSKHTTFANDEEIRREYYPESIELIKKLTGASRVELFDHSKHLCLYIFLPSQISVLLALRRRRPREPQNISGLRQPASFVHVDQSSAGSIARVHRHLPASEVPDLLKRRFQIVNLWRPIANPAVDWPLALCDYRSVDVKKDIFPVALIYPDRKGETLAVKYNEEHKWKYLRGMTPEEIILIKWQVYHYLWFF